MKKSRKKKNIEDEKVPPIVEVPEAYVMMVATKRPSFVCPGLHMNFDTYQSLAGIIYIASGQDEQRKYYMLSPDESLKFIENPMVYLLTMLVDGPASPTA